MLHQVVLEHVYLCVFLRVVGGVAVDDRGRAVVLMLGGVGVQDVHRPLLFRLGGFGLVLLLLRLILQRESIPVQL